MADLRTDRPRASGGGVQQTPLLPPPMPRHLTVGSLQEGPSFGCGCGCGCVSGGTTNPGATGAKEQQQNVRELPHGGACHLRIESTTTLGNGYLGSRIDEERSEMRYMV